MANTIDNSEDYLDVRDVVERVKELRDERLELFEAREAAEAEGAEAGFATADVALVDWDEENGDELHTLESLLADLEGNGGDEQWRGDWYPCTLIRDSYFETSMDELLEDIGVLPKDIPSYCKITVDYDALKMDYSSVEFDGVTYWYR
jgi:hypothetical protein